MPGASEAEMGGGRNPLHFLTLTKAIEGGLALLSKPRASIDPTKTSSLRTVLLWHPHDAACMLCSAILTLRRLIGSSRRPSEQSHIPYYLEILHWSTTFISEDGVPYTSVAMAMTDLLSGSTVSTSRPYRKHRGFQVKNACFICSLVTNVTLPETRSMLT